MSYIARLEALCKARHAQVEAVADLAVVADADKVLVAARVAHVPLLLVRAVALQL